MAPRAVTAIIMQKNGHGMDSAHACLWDSGKDGVVVVPWENQTCFVVATVYGLALHIDNAADLD